MKAPSLKVLLVSLGACVVIVALYELFFPTLDGNPHPAWARSQSIGEVIARAIQEYAADYSNPPAANRNLSGALFGKNSNRKAYLQAAQIPTNQWGYFVDAKNEPYEIIITTDTVTVIGMRGKVRVTKELYSEEARK